MSIKHLREIPMGWPLPGR